VPMMPARRCQGCHQPVTARRCPTCSGIHTQTRIHTQTPGVTAPATNGSPRRKGLDNLTAGVTAQRSKHLRLRCHAAVTVCWAAQQLTANGRPDRG